LIYKYCFIFEEGSAWQIYITLQAQNWSNIQKTSQVLNFKKNIPHLFQGVPQFKVPLYAPSIKSVLWFKFYQLGPAWQTKK
jgi:hypothetical protein